MKVKCYAIFKQNQQPVAQYANPSQKSFLDFQLKQQYKKLSSNSKLGNIQYERTSNGVWYRKFYNESQSNLRGHLLLLATQSASMSLATTVFNKGNQVTSKEIPIQKLKMKLAQIIRMCNANDAKFDKINNNVVQLQGIMKNNISRIADNISDLGNVERKSEIMSSLSMQLQKDSRELERKMKRRKLIMKLIIFGIILLAALVIFYMIFM